MSNGMRFAGSFSSSDQVPFTRTIDPKALGVFVNLEQRDTQRISRYDEHWRFYFGQHWSFTRSDGEPLVTVNILKTIVDKGVMWLIGNGFENVVPEPFVDVYKNILDPVWEHNNKLELGIQVGMTGGVTGDAYILVLPEAPDARIPARVRGGERRTPIKIQLLGSEQVYPIWDPMDTETLLGVKIITLYYEEDAVTAPHQNGPPNYRKFTQVITPTTITEYKQDEAPEVRENILGEIPLVHIRNIVIPREYHGMSDVDCGLLDLQRELNAKATDLSDIINYHASPITCVVGARIGDIQRSPKAIWSGFPLGTEVFNLELKNADMRAHLDYISKVERWMLGTAEQPASAIDGAEQGISNASGVALQMTYQSIIQRTARKKPSYERGLSLVNYFILRYREVLDQVDLPQNFCESCGGKIIDVVVTDKKGKELRNRFGNVITRQRCMYADPETNMFTDPDDVRVQFIRQFSYGVETGEAERWRVVANALNERGSFWDPMAQINQGEVPLTAEEVGRKGQADEKLLRKGEGTVKVPKVEVEEVHTEAPEPTDPTKAEPSANKPPERSFMFVTMKLPEGSMNVPEEPQLITLLRQMVDPKTGEVVHDENGEPVQQEEELLLVPTGCQRPKLFNPYNIPVELNDALPRDEHLDSQLAVQNIAAGLWSRRHGMRRIKVDNPAKMMEEIEKEGIHTQNGQTGDDIPETALQGKELQRQAERGGANFVGQFDTGQGPGRPRGK